VQRYLSQQLQACDAYTFAIEGSANDWFGRHGVPNDFWFWLLGGLLMPFMPKLFRWVHEGFQQKAE
jgi:hypothetical protein